MDEAAQSWLRACELRPRFENAVRALANLLEQMGREGDAAAQYRKLSRLVDDIQERRLFLARALMLEGELDEAEKELRRVIAVAPDHPFAQLLLGRVFLERGSFEEAGPPLLRSANAFPDAFQYFTGSRRMTEEDRPLIDRMRERSERADLDPMPKAALRFGLGKAFDDLGDTAEAMRHYDEGNRLRAASRRMNRAVMETHAGAIISDFSPEAFARRRALSARPLRPEDDLPVFIVGMMRSGSTLVEQILSSHPAVASGGELPFWARRVKSWLAVSARTTPGFIPPRADWTAFAPLAKGVGPMLGSGPSNDWTPSRLEVGANEIASAAQDYLGLIRKIDPGALRVTDKALSNFERLGAIRLALPGARVIHCRRHPVDACLSIYFSNVNARQAWNRSDLVFERRHYERLMEHWRRVLPPDRFLEVDYEALVADPEAETRRLIDFLGLEWDDSCLAPERNARAVRTASVWQVRQPVYKTSIERWRRYEPWLGELRELLPG